MAKKNDTTFFENKLLDFVTAKDPMLEMLQWVMDKFKLLDFVTAKDPMLEMLQWVMDKFMEIEVTHRIRIKIAN